MITETRSWAFLTNNSARNNFSTVAFFDWLSGNSVFCSSHDNDCLLISQQLYALADVESSPGQIISPFASRRNDSLTKAYSIQQFQCPQLFLSLWNTRSFALSAARNTAANASADGGKCTSTSNWSTLTPPAVIASKSGGRAAHSQPCFFWHQRRQTTNNT